MPQRHHMRKFQPSVTVSQRLGDLPGERVGQSQLFTASVRRCLQSSCKARPAVVGLPHKRAPRMLGRRRVCLPPDRLRAVPRAHVPVVLRWCRAAKNIVRWRPPALLCRLWGDLTALQSLCHVAEDHEHWVEVVAHEDVHGVELCPNCRDGGQPGASNPQPCERNRACTHMWQPRTLTSTAAYLEAQAQQRLVVRCCSTSRVVEAGSHAGP